MLKIRLWETIMTTFTPKWPVRDTANPNSYKVYNPLAPRAADRDSAKRPLHGFQLLLASLALAIAGFILLLLGVLQTSTSPWWNLLFIAGAPAMLVPASICIFMGLYRFVGTMSEDSLAVMRHGAMVVFYAIICGIYFFAGSPLWADRSSSNPYLQPPDTDFWWRAILGFLALLVAWWEIRMVLLTTLPPKAGNRTFWTGTGVLVFGYYVLRSTGTI